MLAASLGVVPPGQQLGSGRLRLAGTLRRSENGAIFHWRWDNEIPRAQRAGLPRLLAGWTHAEQTNAPVVTFPLLGGPNHSATGIRRDNQGRQGGKQEYSLHVLTA
jgi:hypothetical protein